MTEALLLFLDREEGFDGWLRLSEDGVSARGVGLAELPAAKGGKLIAVVPGEQVALHWLELPAGLAPAQAQAAARLMAAELSAEPIAEMHVTVGREEEGSGERCVALVPNAVMADWMARLATQGLEPDHVVPETLLIPAPAEGVARFGRGGTSLYRGARQAFALEPELAAMLLGEQPVAELDPAGFEAGVTASLSPPLLDLRQGPFAKRRQWRLERARVRRLALLALAILTVTLIVQVATLLRYTFAADVLEAEAKRVAAAAGTGDLRRRVAELRGGGAGYGATAAAVFAAVRDTPNVELAALSFSPDGSLRATVQGDAPASLSALEARIDGNGFDVQASPLRSGGGRQITDLTVRAR